MSVGKKSVGNKSIGNMSGGYLSVRNVHSTLATRLLDHAKQICYKRLRLIIATFSSICWWWRWEKCWFRMVTYFHLIGKLINVSFFSLRSRAHWQKRAVFFVLNLVCFLFFFCVLHFHLWVYCCAVLLLC